MGPNSDRNQLSHRVSPSVLHHFAESAVSEFQTNHRSLTEHKNSSGKIIKNISPSRRMSKIEEERKS
jgi:ribosomal protein S17E